MAESSEFPVPEEGDTEDVAWALETAGAMWARGDAREAIRWLRRAAETAGDKGLDVRAVTLARKAADLATELQLPPSMPPPPMDESEGTIRDPRMPRGFQLSKSRRSTLETTAISPDDDVGGHDRRRSPDIAIARPHDAFADDRTLAEDEPTVRGELYFDDDPRGMEKTRGKVRSRQALRVSVLPSPDDRNLLLVRPLDEAEPVPPGAHEAFLVAMEAGAHLLARKR